MRRTSALCAVAVFATSAGLAQSVISARSGMVQYVEGKVLLADKPVVPKFGQFPEIKDNQVFQTEAGRAEVLLTPGVFLRLPENSSIRMISSRLTDTRVEVVSGSALVECADLPKDNAITLVYKDWNIALTKKGLYRLDTAPARLRVFDGEAQVVAAKQAVEVKKSKELYFGPVLSAEKFDNKQTDELYRWSSRRSEYLAMASISAAKSLRDSGSSWGASGWSFNPWYGMYTFIPYSGVYMSPFGYNFWSPIQVVNFYRPYYYGYGRGGGYSGGGSSSAINWSPHYDAGRGYNTASRSTFSPPMRGGGSVGGSAGMSAPSGGASRGSMSSSGASAGRSAGGSAGGRGR
jgi:hypothetical protein